MESFSTRMLHWYDRHARTLPWRTSPADGKAGVVSNPYHVWLSEVMLQQTTVATVKSYYEKFLRRWPTVNSLAAASQDEVMGEWAGLGYYSRARNLKACADMVAQELDGRFPETRSDLIKLPGIGDYTASAIAAIAFGERVAVVDGNIERVVTRRTANGTPLPKVKEDCRFFMDRETPADRPGDFVQSMMDLGATICTPRNPACGLCPISADCAARESETMLDFPVKAPKKVKPTRKGAVFVSTREDGAVWMVRRPNTGLLGGMAALPTTDWDSRKDGDAGVDAAPFVADWQAADPIRHTFTHFHLELEVWVAERTKTNTEGWWGDNQDLPTLFKKAVVSARNKRTET